MKRSLNLIPPWIALALLLGTPSTGSADIVVEYDLTDHPAYEPAAPTTLSPAITASDWQFGPGVTAINGGELMIANEWTTDVEVDLEDYIGVTLSPSPGGSMTLETMTFVERRSPSGPLVLSVRSSLDEFAEDIVMEMLPVDTDYRIQTVDFPAEDFTELTMSVELRIYGYAAASDAGSWRFAGSGYLDDDNYPPGLTITGSAIAGPGTPGDFDDDGDVDGADFLIWQRGESPDPLSGTDLSAWSANFGDSQSILSAVAVPEPATGAALLLSVASFQALSRRTKKNQHV